jgi:hypothetical protein
MFLRAYLKKLCDDPGRMEFWEYLDKVGYVNYLLSCFTRRKAELIISYRMMHVGLGRAHPLHIEYIHLGATLAFIQDILTEAILSHPRLTLPRKTALVKAIGKVIWIQNDLFAKWQVGAEESAVESGDIEVVIEREGWLRGKKILAEDEMVGECECKGECTEKDAKDQSASMSACPFASNPKESSSECPVSW